jgi:hypothetical protein
MKVCLKCDTKYDGVFQCPKCGESGYMLVDDGSPSSPTHTEHRYQQVEEDSRNPATGWIIFILIFVVGNAILYATTGIFLIPIPRR